MGRLEELEEYVIDLEEELENLSEQNRLLIIRIQDLQKMLDAVTLAKNMKN